MITNLIIKMKFKILSLTILTLLIGNCIPRVALAQDTSIIKNMILSDLVLLNDIYDSKIVSNQPQKSVVIDGNGVVDSYYFVPSNELTASSIAIVELRKINYDLFSVKVRFNISLGNENQEPLQYFVYRSNLTERYYRIDGFFVSDVFVLKKTELNSIAIFLKNCMKANKYYSSRNRANRCRKYFKCTIMEKLNLKGRTFDTAPVFNSSFEFKIL